MKLNFNFSFSKFSKINGDVIYQKDVIDILKRYKFKINEGTKDFFWLISLIQCKIANLLIRIPIFSKYFNNYLNYFIRSKNFNFTNDQNLTFCHYFYNFNKNLKKIIWSTQGIMRDSYYKNYKNKVSLKSDIKLYKKLDKNNKTIFLFWDKEFAKRTKRLCDLKSIIKIIPPTLNINEKQNKKLKNKVTKIIKILFIGKNAKIKGLTYLLKALRHSSLAKVNYHLDVVSNTTKHNTEKIFFHKNIDNNKIKNLLEEADIFILPTIAETFGYSLMEAIANKCAIITCNYHPLNNFCKENYNGFLINKHNYKDISKSLLKLFHNKKKIERFKENSFKLYKKNFGQEKFIKKFKVVLNEYNKNKFKSDI